MNGIAEALAGLADPRLSNLPGAMWPAEQKRQLRANVPAQLAEVREARVIAPVNPDASEGELRELARRRADLMLDRVAALREPVTLEWLNAEVTALEARPLAPYDCNGAPLADQLAANVKRVCSVHWWARNVRRAATRKREAREQAQGRISVRTAPYVSDETAGRYVRQQARNFAILERTEIESADGELVTLAAAMQASTANPAIRRGELMTRIRGAEEWAAARGMVGLFTTNTAPSRFHATHHKGGRNHRYTGDEFPAGAGNYGPPQDNGPRAAQGWLCKTWARCRPALQRAGVQFFGFRVAEPHHDGCPHWHMLLFVDREQVDALRSTMRAYWLADHPDEPGASIHRFKAVEIDPSKGDAAGYVAKYIAKNIDDTGLGVHLDEAEGEQIEIDTQSGNKARRVLAWASAWGIRQFQAIGQPPVTVWRELRRVDTPAVQGASKPMQQAHEAVNRDGERRACWRAYMEAQGGAMKGRAQRLKLATEHERREGLYGDTEAERIVGVIDVRRPGEIVLSKRKAWKPRGTWTDSGRDSALRGASGAVRDWLFARPKAAQPWTRVNNCTQRPRPRELMRAGIVGAFNEREPGGNHNQGNSSCRTPFDPSPSSLPPWQVPSLRPMQPSSP